MKGKVLIKVFFSVKENIFCEGSGGEPQ